MRYRLRFGLLGPPVLYDAPIDAGSHAHDVSGSGDGAAGPAARTVAGPKTRALLAALLLEAGRVVSVESLKEALWGGAPPLSAHASLHNHVTRLRRLLDEPDRLRTVPSGYLLRVEEGELDVHVFEALAAEARTAQARGDRARVVSAVMAALALWRGAPLAGLPADVGGYAFAQRLRETRLLLLEWRYDAELDLGGARLEGLVPELAALAADHPLREAYHRQLMLALHRTGRRAEALAVHRDLRARLVEELGIEPGPAVREAHVEVLREAATARGSAAFGADMGGSAASGADPVGFSRGDSAPGGSSLGDSGSGGPAGHHSGSGGPAGHHSGSGGPAGHHSGSGGPAGHHSGS
ncbi:AfsR/SARP family transcriptional regulator, partial [Streptomyces viridiviolaceus]